MHRFRTIPRAIVSLLWVLLAYAVYSVCVVPFVEPWKPAEELVAADDLPTSGVGATDRYVRELRPLFPEGSWELDSPKVLRAPQMTVLLKEFKTLDDGSLHIFPCTLIFYGDDRNSTTANKRGPTVLQAPEGAQLTFDEPFDIHTGFPGKPVSGGFVGDIRIFSAGGPESDDLILVTRNVQISKQQIWTPDEVAFWLGDNYGKGRDLLIKRVELDPNSPVEDDRNWLEGLGIIQLEHLDLMRAQVADHDMFDSLGAGGKNDTPAVAENAAASVETSTVEVLCDGPLNFDLRRMIATVEDNVRIVRVPNSTQSQPTQDQAAARPDVLHAHQLTMHLARPKHSNASPTNPNPNSSSGSTGSSPAPRANSEPAKKQKLALKRVVAVGNPLVIDVPSQQAYAESWQLDYDAQRETVVLRGSPSNKTQDGQPGVARVQIPEHEISSPLIEFIRGRDRTDSRVRAGGPGRYVGTPTNTASQPVSAYWQGQLTMAPAAGQDQQVLRIEGNATVQAPGIGGIQTETIELWLRQETVVVQTRLDGTQVTKQKAVPIQLLTYPAPGQKVQIDAPQIAGSLSNLRVVFAQSNQPGALQGARVDGGKSSSRGFLSGDAAKRRKPGQRFRIDGGQLTAWVDATTQDVLRVQVNGQSRLVEESLGRDGAIHAGIELVGETIDYQMDQQGRPIAVLTGNPAMLKSPEMDVKGKHIQLLGNENRIVIPGAGSARMRVSKELFAQQISGRASLDQTATANQKPVRPQPVEQDAETEIEISWQRGLQFNGQVVRIEGKVSASAPDVKVNTELLWLTLDRMLDLTKLASESGSRSDNVVNTPKFSEAKIAFVTAEGGVFAASRSRDELGKSTSLNQIVTRDLNLNYETGDATADGPGWLSVTSLGNRLNLLTSAATTSQNSRTEAPAKRELSQLSVAFARQMAGNLDRREVQFDNDIRAWFGPVDSWEAHVDPLKVEELGKRDFRMNCQELLIYESPNDSPDDEQHPMELIAGGETSVEGQLFWAKGDQIKYVEEKGVLTMEGNDRRPAELWQRSKIGGPANNNGQFMEGRFWPKTKRLQIGRWLGADLTQSRPSSNSRQNPDATAAANGSDAGRGRPVATAPANARDPRRLQ